MDKINTADELKVYLEEFVKKALEEYIDEAVHYFGEELDWGTGVNGFETNAQARQDFIGYLKDMEE